MTRIVWNQVGDRTYEHGLDRGVFYPNSGSGVPWNGLVSIDEGSYGGESEPYYFDGVKYLDIVANQTFQATIEAVDAPPEFLACDGVAQVSPGLYATQQPRTSFGLVYRSLIASDTDDFLGYKIHLVYNATAAPAGRIHKTKTSNPEVGTRQWAISTLPPLSSTYRPTSHLIIDSREVDPFTMANLEDFLYGSDTKEPSLPTQEEVIHILTNPVLATVTDLV